MIESFGEVTKNVDLKKYNTYQIGGRAAYLVKPFNIEKLIELLDYIKNNNINYFILGNGSNVIIPDKYFDGIIIKLDNLNNISIKGNIVETDAGVMLNNLINFTLENGFTSLTNLYGIPGTLGGAIIQNAGCYGDAIFDFIKSVRVLKNGQIIEIDKMDIKYGYRDTEFKNSDTIILSCVLELEKGNVVEAKDIIKNNFKNRASKQPLKEKNAGSVFKNPPGMYVAKLIEECGLKNYSRGGAKVSDVHANFIINYDSATYDDIIFLINDIKKIVKEKKDVDLELEQIIVNW